MIKKLKSGFTLIELLVVISIIGILATLMISRYGMGEKRARDTERKSDLNQYRIALENLAATTGGLYPARPTDQQASTILCADLEPDFLPSCPGPEDPRYSDTSWDFYHYQTNAPGTCVAGLNCATQYILWARMETGSGTTNYWYLCADGRAAEKADTEPATTDCF